MMRMVGVILLLCTVTQAAAQAPVAPSQIGVAIMTSVGQLVQQLEAMQKRIADLEKENADLKKAQTEK